MKFKEKEALLLFLTKKHFPTHGLPFAKVMWRNGYNKALDDIMFHIENQRTPKNEDVGKYRLEGT